MCERVYKSTKENKWKDTHTKSSIIDEVTGNLCSLIYFLLCTFLYFLNEYELITCIIKRNALTGGRGKKINDKIFLK